MEPYYGKVCFILTLKTNIILDVLFCDCSYDKDVRYLIKIRFKNLLKNFSITEFNRKN